MENQIKKIFKEIKLLSFCLNELFGEMTLFEKFFISLFEASDLSECHLIRKKLSLYDFENVFFQLNIFPVYELLGFPREILFLFVFPLNMLNYIRYMKIVLIFD